MAITRNTKLIIGGIVVLAVIVGIGVDFLSGQKGQPSSTTAGGSKELAEIRTYTRTDCGITPYLVADQKGFFAEEGLKLVYTGTVAYPQQLASVLNGNNDIGDAHPNELAMFIKGGAKVKGVSRDDLEPIDEVNAEYRHMKYFVSKDSAIKSWKDIQNYKVGQQILINGTIPSCTTFVPSNIFDRYNLDRNRLKFVTFDSDQQALQAVTQGDIDIAQVHPPYYNLAKEIGLVQIGDSFDAGLGAATGVALYYFPDKYIAEHPDRVQAFVRAITKAQIWANQSQNRKEAAEITAKALNVNSTGTHYYAFDTSIPEEQIQPWLDDLVYGGFLKEGELAVADIITHQFEDPSVK
ncbi:MAG: NMT1/THI5 like protein [Pelotomaculum sp. PtaU1.Bin035]|nr:MAG: NMT1/THI5 like protein [Pelotomaculum sp. PtaU1.Bin035]